MGGDRGAVIGVAKGRAMDDTSDMPSNGTHDMSDGMADGITGTGASAREGAEVASGFVRGGPAGKPSVRAFGRGRGASMWAGASARVIGWRASVDRDLGETVRNLGGIVSWSLALGIEPRGGKGRAKRKPGGRAFGLAVVFTLETAHADRWGKPHTAKPDADNLMKLFMDRAQRAGLFGLGDDAAVAAMEPVKVWGRPGTAGAAWTLRVLGENARATAASISDAVMGGGEGAGDGVGDGAGASGCWWLNGDGWTGAGGR